jgi:hypothetical protein
VFFAGVVFLLAVRLEYIGEVVCDGAHECWSFPASLLVAEVSVVSSMILWWDPGSGRLFWWGDKVAKVVIDASHCVNR